MIEYNSLMWPRTFAEAHPAKQLLDMYAKQCCPIDFGKDCTEKRIIAAVLHGNHKSASSKEAIQALHKETKEKEANGYVKVVRFGYIQNNRPKKIKISPVACIPNKSWSFQVILNLLFNLNNGTTAHPSVNDTTVKHLPPNAMV
eukprot:5359488-Ditylum_brightwellii.AAC.1